MNDERLGLVSASRFEIFALCPGSEQLRRQLPSEALSQSDEYSERGTRLHKAFETGNTLQLEEDDLDIYNRGIATEKNIIAQWCQDFNIEHFTEAEREQRLYLNDPQSCRPVASGQLDRTYLALPYVLIIDFKSLWCSNLTPAERNYQGRLQAVLAQDEWDAKHVRMVFNKAMFGRSDWCDYDADALNIVRFSVFRALWEAEQPGAQLRPGEWCTYCPCKAYCKQAANYSLLPSVQREASLEATLAKIETMPPESALEIWRRKGAIEKIMAAIADRLKGLSAEEHEKLGLKLTDGRKTDFIENVAGVFNFFRSEGLDEGAIFGAMSFSKEPVVKLIQEVRNCSKKKAEELYDKELDPFIKRQRGKKSLVEK